MGHTSLQNLVKNNLEKETFGVAMEGLHSETLKINLSGFNLRIQPTVGDGNCFFRSTIVQLHKIMETCQEISSFAYSIGLGLSVEEDTKLLRQLLVKEITTNLNTYKGWITMETFKDDLENFKQSGYFANNIGDLCAKVCSNVLRVSIVVVTALADVPCLPFIPLQHMIGSSTIYLAYTHYGPGHYDAVTGKLQSQKEKLNSLKFGF